MISVTTTSSYQQYESYTKTTANNNNISNNKTGSNESNSPSQIVVNAATSNTNQGGRSSSSSNSRAASSSAQHNIVVKPKILSNTLGFQLDENEVIQKGLYYVKYVDPNSASCLAGLKEGDKITKINGKSTQGMSYEEFCNEIVIAQQQQLKNNMIHLMVMRRSSKAHATSSYSATATSSISNISGPTVLPIQNHNQSTSILTSSTSSNLNINEKTSSFVDEGYVPGSVTSATSSSTTTPALGNASTTNLPTSGNLVSVIRVTSPTNHTGKIYIDVNKIHVLLDRCIRVFFNNLF